MSKLELNRNVIPSIQNATQTQPTQNMQPSVPPASPSQPLPVDTVHLQSKATKNPALTTGVVLRPIGELLKLTKTALNPAPSEGTSPPSTQKSASSDTHLLTHASFVEEDPPAPSPQPVEPVSDKTPTKTGPVHKPASNVMPNTASLHTLNEGISPPQAADKTLAEPPQVTAETSDSAPRKTPVTRSASPPKSTHTSNPQSPYPRYDKMFQDGLLDVTVAIGYDEPVGPWDGANLNEEQKMDYELTQRGYTADPEKAKQLLKAAGRDIKGSYQGLYVKESIATQNGKPVHSVVRVIKSGQANLNTGAHTRNTALEGMNQSDAFLYGGHARYGSGPDFDRNYKITIDWTDVPNAPASGKVTYDDYEALKNLLSAKGNHIEAIAKFDALEKEGRIGIETSNAGNIVVNKQNKHPGEFGAHLMFKAVATEDTAALKDQILQDSYRLWLFNACRTGDYIDNIRQDGKVNQRLNERNLDLFYTKQTLYWHNTTANVVAFLDGVLAQDNTANLLKRLSQANPENVSDGRTHARQGFDDNPLANPMKP